MPYGNRFFDDLNTYLPALIYEPERFATVQEVLRYVQRQARYHLNRYDRERMAYMRRSRLPRRREAPMPSATAAADGDDLLRTLMGGLFSTTTPFTFMQADLMMNPADLTPVTVRPSAAQIAHATTVSTVAVVQGDDTCAICQELLNSTVNTQLRRINHCNHCFHKNCIDVWFSSHVQCPVCRHDIRD